VRILNSLKLVSRPRSVKFQASVTAINDHKDPVPIIA
jgi:hypothetical protein